MSMTRQIEMVQLPKFPGHLTHVPNKGSSGVVKDNMHPTLNASYLLLQQL